MNAPALDPNWGRAAAKPRAGERIEVYGRRELERVLVWSKGRLEQVEERSRQGSAVRVCVDGRLGFAFRYGDPAACAAAAVEQARALARSAETAGEGSLPEPATLVRSDPGSSGPADPGVWLQQLEQAATAADPRISGLVQGIYRERRTEHWLFGSNTAALHHAAQAYELAAAVLAADGRDQQLAEDFRVWRRPGDLDPETLGRETARRAVGMLGASILATGRYPALLTPAASAGLLEAALPAFSGAAAQEGRSFLAGRLGQTVFSPQFGLLDDSTLENGVYSSPVDAEGTPAQRTELIRQGRVQALLWDHNSARRAGVRSTGNAVRGSLAARPEIGPTNCWITPGERTPAQLANAIGRGVEVGEVMGTHTLNPVTGEFSLAASGWLIEQGRRSRPFKSVTISGRIPELFRRVEGTGQDLTWFGHFGAPTLLVGELEIAGA